MNIDAESTARFLINSWQGAMVRMKVSNDRGPLDDVFAIGFTLLEGGT